MAVVEAEPFATYGGAFFVLLGLGLLLFNTRLSRGLFGAARMVEPVDGGPGRSVGVLPRVAIIVLGATFLGLGLVGLLVRP